MKINKLALIALAIASNLASNIFGANLFVTPTGAGNKDGSSWENAIDGYERLNDIIASGDVIYFSAGRYVITQQLTLTGITSLEMHGGFVASEGTSLVKSTNERTVIAVKDNHLSRHLQASNSSIVLNDIEFTNGSIFKKSDYGMSMNLSKCQIAMTNCAFTANVFTNYVSTGFGNNYGGALYVNGGSLDIYKSLFRDNKMYTTPDNNVNHGGAIYTANAQVKITETDFINNSIYSSIWEGFGAAIQMEGGNGSIERCNFLTNSISGSGHSRNYAYGASICSFNQPSLIVKDSYFSGNTGKGQPKSGGLLYVRGTEGKTEANISRCIFINNGFNDTVKDAHSGSICLNGGTLRLENTLIAGTKPANSKAVKRSVEVLNGNLEITKCTITDSNGTGVYRDVVYGHVAITESIIYGNATSVANVDSVEYCCIEGGFDGIGNFDSDPLLSTDGYFHPLSKAGHLQGFLEGSDWVIDNENSPTIDTANILSDWFDEPQPNNLRANIGYDANTSAASKSAVGDFIGAEPLTVYAIPATNLTVNSACIRGILASTGADDNAEVYLCWDTDEVGTDATESTCNVVVLGSFKDWEHITYSLGNLQKGQKYYYRLFARNDSEEVFSTTMESFTIPSEPILEKVSPSHISRFSVNLNATVMTYGDGNCTITFSYWKKNSPSDIKEVSYEKTPSDDKSLQLPISSLAAITEYSFKVSISNVAGSHELTGDFTTLSTEIPINRYVSPNGAGIQDGSSWENAYQGLLPAIAECKYAGDTIYMLGGSYDDYNPDYVNSHIVISDAKGLTIKGGYDGNGAPGNIGATPSVIESNPKAPWRLIKATKSTLTFENIKFFNGKYPVCEATGGAALWLDGCNTIITNCIFEKNQIYFQSGESTLNGGAIYAFTSGSLDIYDSAFKDNMVRITSSQGSAKAFGGAISAKNCKLNVINSVFDNNIAGAPHNVSVGGAIYVDLAIAKISDCLFYTNKVLSSSGHSYAAHAYGGALMAYNTPEINVSDSIFLGNYGIGRFGRGGVVHLMDNDGYGVMTQVFTRCVFDFNGTNNATVQNDKAQLGSFHHDSGRLFMTNCLISRSGITGGFASEHTTFGNHVKTWKDPIVSEVDLVNITVADCSGIGISQPATGTATLKILNSIAWNNSQGDISNATTVAYSCSSEKIDGVGNITANPLLSEAPYYHLISRSMYITNGWFGGSFVNPRQRATSPCVDAGDPTFDASHEPHPAKRINMGAYGGTPWTAPTWYNKGSVLRIE